MNRKLKSKGEQIGCAGLHDNCIRRQKRDTWIRFCLLAKKYSKRISSAIVLSGVFIYTGYMLRR